MLRKQGFLCYNQFQAVLHVNVEKKNAIGGEKCIH